VQGDVWLSIAGGKFLHTFFISSKNDPQHVSALIGRHKFLDNVGFSWVGPKISDEDLALLPEQLRTKGKLTLYNLH